MRLFIIPTEPLLFRHTGRSFSAGESGYADSLFPPTPETLQGAIRAAIATYWNRTMTLSEAFQQKELVDLIGDRTGYGRFRITGIALGRQKADATFERLFPAPAYLQKDKNRIVRFFPKPLHDVQSNIPNGMQYLWCDSETEEKLKSLDWLTEEGLRKALQPKGDLTEDDIISNDKIFAYEPRLGIGMNNETKTTREGLLYQMRMVRINHSQEFVYGFVVDISLAPSSESGEATTDKLMDDGEIQKLLQEPGWITLGGERRAARFEILTPPASTQQDEIEQAKKGNLLYLATPAAFDGGWQPTSWPDPLGRPIAAAIERYQSVGGWLLTPGNSGGQNKSIRRCVPAGSVYFFNRSVTVTRPFTDYGWQIGYGIVYAGEW